MRDQAALREKRKSALCGRGSLTDDRHALSVAVEVEESEHLVRDLFAHLVDCDGVLRARLEHEAKTASRCDQSTFIRRRSLIHQVT